MRHILSADEEPPVSEVINSTSILEIIASILDFKVTNDELYFLRCEALWMLINLATVEETHDMEIILASTLV